MRRFVLGLLAVLLLSVDGAAAQTVTGAQLTWYGIYTVGKTVQEKDSGSVTGFKNVSSGISAPSTNTDRISFVDGVRFGFGFELIGTPPNAQVTLKYISKFPPPGRPDAATGKLKIAEETSYSGLAINRKDLFIGRVIGDDSLEGTYTMQVWYIDRLLVEKSFTLEPR